jgi:hypothetical protein
MWTGLVRSATLPALIRGYNESGQYGVTNLDIIHDIGREEYTSEDPRYKRKTFAIRLGYVGTAYKVSIIRRAQILGVINGHSAIHNMSNVGLPGAARAGRCSY